MSIIPVLDLMIGQVVLAQGGNRDAYRPVHSRLTTSSRPLEVAQAIFNQTGCDWLYLADIDSFAGAAPNWNVHRELLDRGFGLWLDADWLTNDRYLDIAAQLNPDRLKIIISSETISSRDQFSVFSKLIDSGLSPIFSLDKKGDAIVSQSDWLTTPPALSPYELVQLAYQQGVRDFIVLDLAEVGASNGFQASGSSALLAVEADRNSTFSQRVVIAGSDVPSQNLSRNRAASRSKAAVAAKAMSIWRSNRELSEV